MNNYEIEKNTNKWLAWLVSAIIILTVFLVIKSVLIIQSSNDKQNYQKGYKDAKLVYECDHDRAECEIIKDTL